MNAKSCHSAHGQNRHWRSNDNVSIERKATSIYADGLAGQIASSAVRIEQRRAGHEPNSEAALEALLLEVAMDFLAVVLKAMSDNDGDFNDYLAEVLAETRMVIGLGRTDRPD